MQRVKTENSKIPKSCANCGNKFSKGVQCGICEKHYDLRCANVSEIGYRRLEFEGKDEWKCTECRPLSPESLRSGLNQGSTQKPTNKLKNQKLDKAKANSSEVALEKVAPFSPRPLLKSENVSKAKNSEFPSSPSEQQEMLPVSLKHPKSLLRQENSEEVLKNVELFSSHRISNSSNVKSSEITLVTITSKLDSISSMLEFMPDLINEVKDIKSGLNKMQGLSECELCVQTKVNSNILSVYGKDF